MIRPVEIYLNNPPPDPATPRPVHQSQVTFADLAEPQSQNVAGTLFGGVLLGFIDRAAAFCAMKHAGRPVVTRSFDEVEFNEPIYIGELVIAHASVNFTGTTSMEVGVRVRRHRHAQPAGAEEPAHLRVVRGAARHLPRSSSPPT
jgi:acyl-CoA hydrolase